MNDDLKLRHYLPYIFNYRTTMKTDYRRPRVMLRNPEARKPKIKCLMSRPATLKDGHTFSSRHPRQSYVPYNLYHKPRDIIDTSPGDIQKPFYKPEDQDRLEVQKTRPRVYMTPAISLDDAEEPSRQILLNSIYTTAMKEAMNYVSVPSEYIRAPLSEVYASSNEVKIPPLRQPYVSPEWRMQSVSWDKKQMRGHVDPTKTFWLNMEPNCNECKTTAVRKAQREMMRRI